MIDSYPSISSAETAKRLHIGRRPLRREPHKLGIEWIEIVSGAGHFPMLDKPQAVNQILAAFVTEIAHVSEWGSRRGGQ
jgi:pimeloyl-ACP methyl ester carboxylesterase